MQEKVDLRALSEADRFLLAKTAIRMISKGMRQREVAFSLGIRESTISRWKKLYQEGGVSNLKSKHKGRKSEDMKLLSPQIESELKQLITSNMPDQLKLSFGLWTRKAVKELIKERYNIDIAITTTGRYLRSWGFSPQKPTKRAYEQNDKKVKEWLEVSYPTIKKRAKEESAEIHWGDETGIKNSCNHGRSYNPKGKTPVKKVSAKRISTNMISTITNQGKVRFMIYDGTMDSQMLLQFFRRLIKNAGQKIFLILDNLRVHHSKKVSQWIEDHKDKIELFFLPAYSPEKNPDEYLNCDLKCEMSKRKSPKNKQELKDNVRNHMRSIRHKPDRIKKYFKNPQIAYAA